MPPKRCRLVVDDRQHPPIAAPASAAPAAGGGRASGTPTAVSGVVSLEEEEARSTAPLAAVAAAPRRPLLPAGVLARLPDAAKRLYQTAETTAPSRVPAAAEAVASAEHQTSDSSATGVDGGIRAAQQPASPTGSALEEDVAQQIAQRRRADEAPVTSAKPLFLSTRWQHRLRARALPLDRRAEAGVASRSPSASSSSDAEAEEQGDDGAREDGGALWFDAAKKGSKRDRNAFGADHIAFGGGSGSASGGSSSDDEEDSTSSEDGDRDAVYDSDDGMGEDGFADGLGLNGAISADKRKMLVEDPAVEKQIRARQMAHLKREREREGKLRRQFNRHMAGYDDETLKEQERLLLLRSASETESEEEDDDDEDEGNGFDNEQGEDDAQVEPTPTRARNESGGGFGAHARFQRTPRERPQQPQEEEARGESRDRAGGGAGEWVFPESSPLSHRQRFGSIFFETHVDGAMSRAGGGGYPCHHTLLCLKGPITIQGPCGLIGFGIGEVSVGGFLLGKKQFVLWTKEEKAVLMPMKRLRTKASERMDLPDTAAAARRAALIKSLAAGSVPAVDPLHAAAEVDLFSSHLLPPKNEMVHGEALAEDDEADAMPDVEAAFGRIDWDWVQATVKTWRELFKDRLPTMFLVIQPVSLGGGSRAQGALFHSPMRRHYLHSARSRRRMRNRRLLLQQQQRSGEGEDGEPARGQGRRDAQRGTKNDGRSWLQEATDEEMLRLEGRWTGAVASDDQSLDTAGGQGRGGVADGAVTVGGAFVDIPSFISRQSQQNIDLALVPDIVPSVTRLVSSGPSGGSVVVVGSQDIGKSTLCRFLANAFLSQHGLCFWLDLDLGQPEFGVPGTFSLSCVRRPLLRAHDAAAAEVVKMLFIGSPTASSPQAVGQALSILCGFVAEHVSRRHPVVVNTHGWVLHTGRRVTVEAIQRLLPKVVIHLVKEREEAWASDTANLLNPTLGLNAEVVGKRFHVRNYAQSGAEDARAGGAAGEDGNQSEKGKGRKGRKGISSSSGASPAAVDATPLLGRLPRSHISSSADAGGQPTSAWDGTVYTVRVNRETDALKQRAARRKEKGSAGRQRLWQSYLAPLIAHYEQADDGSHPAAARRGTDASTTALLRAPLSCVDSVVLGEADERRSGDAVRGMSLTELAATLEHRVVGVQFRYPAAAGSEGHGETKAVCSSATALPTVLSLDGLPSGFEVSCFGYVESSERDMLCEASNNSSNRNEGGAIAIRVPLPQREVIKLLSSGEPRLSLAVSPGMLHDTHFMEFYP